MTKTYTSTKCWSGTSFIFGVGFIIYVSWLWIEVIKNYISNAVQIDFFCNSYNWSITIFLNYYTAAIIIILHAYIQCDKLKRLPTRYHEEL